jgi:hypothetical protein
MVINIYYGGGFGKQIPCGSCSNIEQAKRILSNYRGKELKFIGKTLYKAVIMEFNKTRFKWIKKHLLNI